MSPLDLFSDNQIEGLIIIGLVLVTMFALLYDSNEPPTRQGEAMNPLTKLHLIAAMLGVPVELKIRNYRPAYADCPICGKLTAQIEEHKGECFTCFKKGQINAM